MTSLTEEWARNVEKRLVSIETRLDSFATKEDLANLKFELFWRMALLQLMGLGAVAAIMRFVS